MDQAVDMEVVEKPLDVEEQEACDVAGLETCLYRMDHTQDGVRGGVVVSGSKLPCGEEVESSRVK